MTVNKLTYPSKENAVQEKINEIIDNNADNTLSNVSSIDSNSAVATALDGKVSKSGDTMTGDLAISEDANAKIELTNTSFDSTSTTAPTSNLYAGAIDIFGLDNYHVGHFRTRHSSANYFQSQMGVRRSINNTDYEANITVSIRPDGTTACTFPNTTCVDGQWVSSQYTIAHSVSVNGSTPLEYSLSSYLPNDSYDYEVFFDGYAITSARSGSVCPLAVYTDISVGGGLCRVITRANAACDTSGCVALPVGISRKITVARGTNYNGNLTLRAIGYRRIGTNN